VPNAKKSKSPKSKTPREGSLAWERSLHESPTYVANTVKDLAQRASRGDAHAAKCLEFWLRQNPEMRSLVPQLDGLRAATEGKWIKFVAGEDLVRERAVREEVERMKAELLGENPSVMDKVLVSNFVVAYLANQRALCTTAQHAESVALVSARGRWAEGAARRLLLATKALALVQGMKNRRAGARPKLSLFDTAA
jgi:hypothetical protein